MSSPPAVLEAPTDSATAGGVGNGGAVVFTALSGCDATFVMACHAMESSSGWDPACGPSGPEPLGSLVAPPASTGSGRAGGADLIGGG